MSMLAEKKRRDKWSLNPRGKAWSEDHNKFGQRLMEKMGWKAGQGLGANSQGLTDIIKTKVKNDSKGLGFKENGEEWLKTTSDFEVLLDELASSREDSGDGSQNDTPTSLEDRSKKSRVRVHYHKFTRGKDLSRYSEKDLASIIGPDVVKLKNCHESKSDYTLNQVNKGSLEDYFSNKSTSKNNKSVGNTSSDEKCDVTETVITSKNDVTNLNDNNMNPEKLVLESELSISSKKRKKRKNCDSNENETQVNISDDDHRVNSEVKAEQHNLETKVFKKEKKRKSSCYIENSTDELEENHSHSFTLMRSSEQVKKEKKKNTETLENKHLKESSAIFCESNDNISKRKKRKHEQLSYENSEFLENEKDEAESNTKKLTLEKKKRKIAYLPNTEFNDKCAGDKETLVCDEASKKKKYKEHYGDIQFSNNSHVIAVETVVCDEIAPKKKKQKNVQTYNNDQKNINFHTYTDFLVAEETSECDETPSKNKKSKKENQQHQENNECTINNAIGSGEAVLLIDETLSKKKKSKEKILEHEEGNNFTNSDSVVAEDVVSHETFKKKKNKPKEGNLVHQGDNKCTNNNLVIAIEAVVGNEALPKKKKRKSKEEKYQEGNESKTSDFEVTAEALINDEMGSKKKKKKFKDENSEYEDMLSEEQTGGKNKQFIPKETDETSPGSKQVLSPNKAGDFLEVLGRRTRLKNIKIPCNKAANDIYQTEEFISLGKSNISEKEAIKEETSLPKKTENDLGNKVVYIYRESNPFDCSIRKDILSYENKLVKTKLSKLKPIKKPCVVITDSKNLTKSVLKKLEELHRIRYYKSFLSEQDIIEVDKAVEKFSERSTQSVKKTPKETQNKVVGAKTEGTNITERSENLKVVKEKFENKKNSKVTPKETQSKTAEEKVESVKCYGEINTDDCSVPKYVVAYEYRLVAARLKHLAITPPTVKVVIRDSLTVNETTRRKLRQITKTRHLKTLLPPDDLKEIEASVARFHDNVIRPKSDIMKVTEEMEERISEIARSLDGKAEFNGNKDETKAVKCMFSEKAEGLQKLIQKLEILLENFRKTKDESTFSGDAFQDSPNAEDEDYKMESTSSWLKRVEEKCNILKEHMKMLSEGKMPSSLKTKKESPPTTKKNQKETVQWNRCTDKNHYQNTTYSRGRIAHNVGNQRGRGRGIGRGQPAPKGAVPFGGWGILKSYGSGAEAGFTNENLYFRGSFGHRGGGFVGAERDGYSERGGFLGRGRGGFGDRQWGMGRGRGGFSDRQWGMGRGRGGFSDGQRGMGRGRGGFDDGQWGMGRGRGCFGDGQWGMGRGRGGFGDGQWGMGRGRSSCRGRGWGDVRVRGRISQNNFDAKLYAEKCKELNKLPDVCFNGVNLKVISGYAADISKTSVSNNNESKPLES